MVKLSIILEGNKVVMLRTGLRIPSPLTPYYFHLDASFISRLANTDDIDRPIYGLSAQIYTGKKCSSEYIQRNVIKDSVYLYDTTLNNQIYLNTRLF